MMSEKQDQVESAALLVSTYYATLVRNGVLPEAAEQLTSEWQASMMKEVSAANARKDGADLLARMFGKKV